MKHFHRQVWFNGHREDLDSLTPDEIADYNTLSESLPGPGSERLLRGGTWRVSVRPDNKHVDLIVPCKNVEQIMNIPASLRLVIREFLGGPQASDPNLLLENAAAVRDLQAQIVALRASISPHA